MNHKTVEIFRNKKIRTKRFTISLVLCMSILLLLAGCNSESGFSGDSVRNKDGYYLDAKILNDTMEHTIALSEGDKLVVQTNILSGKVNYSVGIDGEEPIYTGTENAVSDNFTLHITKSGEYVIKMTGEKFKGRLDFKREQ